jgi:hypothetical protein
MVVEYRELPAGDRGVEDDRELGSAGVGQPLVLAGWRT